MLSHRERESESRLRTNIKRPLARKYHKPEGPS
jgi:hypothetical protein